jgi:hypothetical protein
VFGNNGKFRGGNLDWEEAEELESLSTAHETPTVLRSELRLARKTVSSARK